MSDILLESPAPGVRLLTLNRPDSLNAFTFEMYEELIDYLESFRFDHSVRVIILTGAGRGFCAGHDTRVGSKPAWVSENIGPAQRARDVFTVLGRIPTALRSLPQPVIAAVNGAAAGIGYSLAVAADLCVASTAAKFVNAFHNAGTGHELGLSYMLPRSVGTQRAAELLYTARSVPASEAAQIGLVLKTVEPDQLLPDALSLAAAIAANSPIGVALTKQSLWLNQSVGSLEAAMELENRAVFMSQTTQDTQERRNANIERRAPIFTGE